MRHAGVRPVRPRTRKQSPVKSAGTRTRSWVVVLPKHQDGGEPTRVADAPPPESVRDEERLARASGGTPRRGRTAVGRLDPYLKLVWKGFIASNFLLLTLLLLLEVVIFVFGDLHPGLAPGHQRVGVGHSLVRVVSVRRHQVKRPSDTVRVIMGW